MIFKSIQLFFLLLFIYITLICYQKLSAKPSHPSNTKLSYLKQTITFSNQWNNSQFKQYQNTYQPLSFHFNQQVTAISVQLTQQQQPTIYKISMTTLQLQQQDLQQITSIKLINNSHKILLLQSKFFQLLFSLSTNKLCYKQTDLSPSTSNFQLDHQSRLWIFSHPNNNILILRIFSCQNQELLYSWKNITHEKIQLISSIEVKESILEVKALTFSRNYIFYKFNTNTFTLQSTSFHSVSSFQYFTKPLSDYQITLSKKISDNYLQQSFQQFIYSLTFGFVGKNIFNTDINVNQNLDEYDFQFQAFDLKKNILIHTTKQLNHSQIISFDQFLIPLRTPLFISKQTQNNLLPLDQLIDKQTSSKIFPLTNFKIYGIKTKNLQIIKNKCAIYRLLPDSKVHFVTYDNKYFTFYPHANVNMDDYYIVRTSKGGIILDSRQPKGIFDSIPTRNPQTPTLKFGYSSDQIYHEHTTNGIQIIPGIYEAHIIHKGLFVFVKSNKAIQLIMPLNGQPAITHYITPQYIYSTSYIENNQFWVFEHKQGSSPLITKYQLFINASTTTTAKRILYIKRNYLFSFQGQITRVQKCIDYFYYFTYITQTKRYGIARIHHILLSNRQPRSDDKYSGNFQKSLILYQIQRNHQFPISPYQQQLLICQFSISSKIIKNWKQLQFKHQYKILPIRMYSYQNQYYILNLRKLMLQAYHLQIKDIKYNFYFYLLFLSIFFILIITILFVINFFKNFHNQQLINKEHLKKKNN